MKIGTHEFEVSTEPYHDGWRAVAFLPGGKQRASATWDSKEAAEMDLYKQLKDEFAPAPKFDPTKTYEAKAIVSKLLEVDEPPPEHYLGQLPPAFDPEVTMERIQSECAYCMDSREDKQAFLDWIKSNEDLFPDVAKAMAIIQRNDSWCTDSEDDMLAFCEALGFQRSDDTCPKCGGSGEEPGAPVDYAEDGTELIPRCDRCNGAGRILTHCECDNTHQHNNTVCRWCWARGRRHFDDPPV